MGKVIIDSRMIATDIIENDEIYKEVDLSMTEWAKLDEVTKAVKVSRKETYDEIEEYMYKVVNMFLLENGYKLINETWAKNIKEMSTERKSEILDSALEYISEHCEGGELINALINIIGIKKGELKYFGFDFGDDVWKDYEESF